MSSTKKQLIVDSAIGVLGGVGAAALVMMALCQIMHVEAIAALPFCAIAAGIWCTVWYQICWGDKRERRR